MQKKKIYHSALLLFPPLDCYALYTDSPRL